MDETYYDLLLAQGLTPEMIEELVNLGALQTEEDILGRQRDVASGFLAQPTAEARSYGNVYRHAHPLEHLSTALSRGLGAYQMRRLGEQERGISEQRVGGRQALLNAILGRNRTPRVPSPPSLTQPMSQPPTFGYEPENLRQGYTRY